VKQHHREFLLAYALCWLILSAYVSSLSLPFATPMRLPEPQESYGTSAFILLYDRLGGAGLFAWLANPLLWVGCVLLLFRVWGVAAVAGCLALSFGLINSVVLFDGKIGLWSRPLVGYYLWIASLALLACSGVLHEYFFPTARVVLDVERIARLEEQQRLLAAQLAELKQQVEGVADHHVAAALSDLDLPAAKDRGP
jgi:hypothetical protein